MSPTITLVVHGTFASEAKWWRLGGDGEETFADRLESELSRRSLSGTVWKPALAEGFDYSSFAWSGRNRHRDRVRGARGLSSSLNQLAQRVAATPTDPLTVNFVAHSHGGNVVLESLRRLHPNVQVGRIALLGTPLVTAKPAFRMARFVTSTAVLAFFFLCLLLVVIQLGTLLFTGHFLNTEPEVGPTGLLVREGVKGWYILAILIPTLVAYGWLFWLFGNLLDVAWRVVCRPLQPLAWLRGRASALVYGPSPRKLATRLGGQPILLLTSHNDEADLLLQVTSTPARLYREYVATEFSKVGRLLELVLLRPFVLGVLLKVSEVLLETFSLGFSLWKSLFLDFEVAPLDERPYYPPSLLIQQRVELHPRSDPAMADRGDEAAYSGSPPNATLQPRGLRLSLQEVTQEVKRQIQLRHSTYYESRAVVEQLAHFLTGGEVKAVQETKPPPSLKPSGNFWEALLVGNVALAVLYTWITGTAVPGPWRENPAEARHLLALMKYILWLGGYVYPMVALGIIVVFYMAVRRRMPLKLWRWFWVLWAAWGLIVVLAALAIRHGS